MKVSAEGAQLIAGFEGGEGKDGLFHPYRDPVGVWTIAYGHTAGVGPHSTPLTRAQALTLLRHDLDHTYGPAVNALGLPLNQHQFDALVSFVYNVGPGGIANSTTVGRELRAHHWKAAADALLAWDKAGGRVLPGLVRRRQAERALFLEPVKVTGKQFVGYTANEKQMLEQYDRLKRAHRKIPASLRASMIAQRKRIWRAAEHDPQGRRKGWAKLHRHQRYASLLARTT